MDVNEKKKDPIAVTVRGRQEFGRVLSEYRCQAGMSLDDAVAFIGHRAGKGMSKSTLGDIENGVTKQIKLDTLLLFCQSGWGGIGLREMIDILTDRGLSACEDGAIYNLCNH